MEHDMETGACENSSVDKPEGEDAAALNVNKESEFPRNLKYDGADDEDDAGTVVIVNCKSSGIAENRNVSTSLDEPTLPDQDKEDDRTTLADWNPMKVDHDASRRLTIEGIPYSVLEKQMNLALAAPLIRPLQESQIQCKFSNGLGKFCDRENCKYAHESFVAKNGRMKLQAVSPLFSDVVLPYQLPRKIVGSVGDTFEAWICHIESLQEFYIIPKQRFDCGSISRRTPHVAPKHLKEMLLKRVSVFNGQPVPISCASINPKSFLLQIAEKNEQASSEVVNGISERKKSLYQQHQIILRDLDKFMKLPKSRNNFQQLAYSVGEIVAVRLYVWMRAIITKVCHNENSDSDQTYQVQLLDCGRKETVSWDQMANLPKRFGVMQPLAYKCGIGGVKLCSSKIEELRTNKFKKLVEANCKNLVELTLLESPAIFQGQWPSPIEREPNVVEVETLDDDGNYVNNVALQISKTFHGYTEAV